MKVYCIYRINDADYLSDQLGNILYFDNELQIIEYLKENNIPERDIYVDKVDTVTGIAEWIEDFNE